MPTLSSPLREAGLPLVTVAGWVGTLLLVLDFTVSCIGSQKVTCLMVFLSLLGGWECYMVNFECGCQVWDLKRYNA